MQGRACPVLAQVPQCAWPRTAELPILAKGSIILQEGEAIEAGTRLDFQSCPELTFNMEQNVTFTGLCNLKISPFMPQQ